MPRNHSGRVRVDPRPGAVHPHHAISRLGKPLHLSRSRVGEVDVDTESRRDDRRWQTFLSGRAENGERGEGEEYAPEREGFHRCVPLVQPGSLVRQMPGPCRSSRPEARTVTIASGNGWLGGVRSAGSDLVLDIPARQPIVRSLQLRLESARGKSNQLGRVDKTWSNWVKDGPHSLTTLAKEGLSCGVMRSPMITGIGSRIFCLDGKAIPG